MRRAICATAFVLLSAFASPALAQSADEHIRIGEELIRNLKPAAALEHLEAAIRMDSASFDALWRASMSAVDLGEFEKDKKKQEAYYRKGELYARMAVALREKDAESRFHLARALGMVALSVGVRDRVKYAREIREIALEALKLDSLHPGALHVMGVWNAEVMRLSGIERTLAKAFLGAGFFSQASWDDALSYLERATAVEPDRLAHHLDLARVYRDRKMKEKARASYDRVIEGHPLHANDAEYKKQAAAEKAKVR